MANLTAGQLALLGEWLGTWETDEDYSWPLQVSTVLRVRNADGDHIVKASAPAAIVAEIDAHRNVLGALSIPVPRLEHYCAVAGLLVTSYLPGTLTEGTAAEWDPETYRQAGALLAVIQVPGEICVDYVDRTRGKIRQRLADADGLVPAAQLTELSRRSALPRDHPVRMHFTHGDYQPRNWLSHDGTVGLIDFGQSAQRPWVRDLVRLRNQQFVRHPELECAFYEGLGRQASEISESDAAALTLATIAQSLGTVVWAHQMGQTDFLEHGRTMIERFLDTSVSA